MTQNVQLGLLIVLIVALYVISSRWQPEDESQRKMRVSYWIGLAIAGLLVLFIVYTNWRYG